MVKSQDWTSEFKLAFKHLRELYEFLQWELPAQLLEVERLYPVFIPRSLAKKIKEDGPTGVLAQEFLPVVRELAESGLEDPIGDKTFLKAPQLIHRYPSRALFTPTTVCPVHCRYCFRKNELQASDEIFQQDFEQTLSYLSNHPEISEIIFTGGDPLTLSSEKLYKFFQAFSMIPSIKDIRLHSRYPVIFPERIDEDLIRLFNDFSDKFRTITIAVHTNHIKEFNEKSFQAITKLSRTKVQLLSQTVLLRGVNDSTEDLLELFNLFLELKIRPYYLHHPDRVKGGMHFYLPLEEGRKIFHSLRKSLPGWALPHYVIDVPGGSGKISAFNPEDRKYSGQLMNLEGQTLSLPEPEFFV